MFGYYSICLLFFHYSNSNACFLTCFCLVQDDRTDSSTQLEMPNPGAGPMEEEYALHIPSFFLQTPLLNFVR